MAKDDFEIDREWQRRINVDEYHRMIEAGVFDEDEHVELLEGVLIVTPPHGPPHARAIVRLTRILIRALSDDYEVRPQLPITSSDYSEPEPDLAVVMSKDRPGRHPRSALLAIEVSDSTLRMDRKVKAAIYARAGVPEYWIVNVRAKCIERHRNPDRKTGRYRTLTTHDVDDVVTPKKCPGVSIRVGDLFS